MDGITGEPILRWTWSAFWKWSFFTFHSLAMSSQLRVDLGVSYRCQVPSKWEMLEIKYGEFICFINNLVSQTSMVSKSLLHANLRPEQNTKILGPQSSITKFKIQLWNRQRERYETI